MPDYSIIKERHFVKNIIETNDNLILNLDFFKQTYNYYDSETFENTIVYPKNRRVFYRTIFTLSDKQVTHKREAYTLFDLIGDVGGFYDGIILIVSFFISGIVEHNHFLSVVK